MGTYTTALQLLDKLDEEDTRIISFGSWRSWPRWSYIDPIIEIKDPTYCWSGQSCFDLTVPMNHTMLQTYNCDRQPPGQKSQSMPAEKQFYRAEYVTQHFVHYSAATQLSAKNKTEYLKEVKRWRYRGFPDARQRFGDEINEGLMLHTKSVAHQDTTGWQKVCHIDNMKVEKKYRGLCRLGVPWPTNPAEISPTNATEEGWAYNCYPNQKLENYFIPRLDQALKDHNERIASKQ
jgi:hypothetical protein